MNDRTDVWPNLIHRLVERKFRRWLMTARDHAVRFNADNITAGQTTFVDPSWRDPDISRPFAKRDVAAGSRGHAVPIDALHRAHDLVARVGHLPAHTHRRTEVWREEAIRKAGKRNVGCGRVERDPPISGALGGSSLNSTTPYGFPDSLQDVSAGLPGAPVYPIGFPLNRDLADLVRSNINSVVIGAPGTIARSRRMPSNRLETDSSGSKPL